MTFEKATLNHSIVKKAFKKNASHAKSLWNACLGLDVDLDAHGAAVLETMPPELAQLMADGATPTAFAFSEHHARTPKGHEAPFEVRQSARNGWYKVLARSEHTKPLMEGLGMDYASAWAHQEAYKNNYNVNVVKQIAILAGRMYTTLKESRANKANQAPEEIYSVELGDDLPRLLPCELAHLGQPTEIALIERLADKRALQYAVRGETIAMRGPLVILLDESGSMRSNPHRNIWAKAATIAISRIALEDNRPVSIIHYSTSCVVHKLAPNEVNSLLAIAQHFLSGGTDIPLAIYRGVKEIKEMARSGHRGADMVLITDGKVNDIEKRKDDYTESIDRLHKTGGALWTIAIECEHKLEAQFRSRATRYIQLNRRDINSGEITPLQGCVNPK